MPSNRRMRRKILSEMSLEERTKEARTRQYIERMRKAHLRASEHGALVADKNVSPLAKKLANILIPSWYIKGAFFVLMRLPGLWKMFILNLPVPDALRFIMFAVLCFPITVLTFALSLIFLVPIKKLRSALMNWGLQLRLAKEGEYKIIMRIFKWGAMIDESCWEI